MPLFDAYIFVDWGAANQLYPEAPAADALWVGEFPAPDYQAPEKYFRTRHEAVDHVLARLLHHQDMNNRVLVGFDFPYGYPKGFASSLYLPKGWAAWWSLWTELSVRITDDAENRNNRFQVASDLNRIISGGGHGPFWGCPENQGTEHLATNGFEFPFHAANGVHLERLRLCEERVKGVQEEWKLFYAGSVGSQALTGVPRVHFLRRHPELAAISQVWPFETGFTLTPTPPAGPFILHAEIWPGVLRKEVLQLQTEEKDLIRDQAQVRAMCQWTRVLDERGELGALFGTPPGLDSDQVDVCIKEEGWILGG